MKLTSIYPAHIKPVRKGVYKTGLAGEKTRLAYYSFWNGTAWGWFCETRAEAMSDWHSFSSADQDKRWQGLATKDGK